MPIQKLLKPNSNDHLVKYDLNQKQTALIFLISIVIIMTGSLVFLGWIFDISWLKSVIPGAVSMKANTAISFFCFGLSLLILIKFKTQHWSINFFASLPLAIGSLTILEFLFNINLEIDELIFKDPTTLQTSSPGRMSPVTALCFSLLGAAVLLRQVAFRKNLIPTQIFSFIVTLLGYMAIIGYLQNAQDFYRVKIFTSMAVHTAFCFLLSGSSLLLLYRGRGFLRLLSSGIGGAFFVRLLPVALFLPVIIISITEIGVRHNYYHESFGRAISAVTISLLFIIVLHRIIKFVTTPITNLAATANVIANGQFQLHIDESATGEIAQLTSSFNRMTSELIHKTEQHKKSESKLISILDNVGEGIITINANGNILSFNKAAEKLFGHTFSDIHCRSIKVLVDENEHVKLHKYLFEPKHSDSVQIINHCAMGKRKDGANFQMEFSITPIIVESKTLYVGIFRDISERTRIDQLKTEFVSTISHELRTPLTSIVGSLSLISSGAVGEVSGKPKQLLDVALRNSNRLLFLINDLLDMEKIIAGKMQFNMRVQPLLPILTQAIETNSSYGLNKHVRLLLNSATSNVEVNVDDQRLLQVMANLLSNAIKFSPDYGVVNIGVQMTDEVVRVSVSDQGAGIPVEFRHRIFQKFSQADSSNIRQNSGTGLGLAITLELIKRMGGEINFDTEINQGTCFYFTLPIPHKYDQNTLE